MQATTLISETQDEIDNDGRKQSDAENGGTKSIIVRRSTPFPYGSSSPMEGNESIYHNSHSNERKHPCTDLANLVAGV